MDRNERTTRDDRTVYSTEANGSDEARVLSETPDGAPRYVELRGEELVAHRRREEVGEVRVRTVVEEIPSRVAAQVTHDEVHVEHVPVDQEVDQRYGPWEEDGAQVIPVYEERLVLVKQLVLKEKVLIRRVEVSETRPIETSVRRERVEVDHSPGVVVRENGLRPEEGAAYSSSTSGDRAAYPGDDEPGPLERVVRKFLA